MKKSKRIAVAIVLDVGFLAFLYFVPIVYYAPFYADCPPEALPFCSAHYESLVLVATSHTGNPSIYGAMLTEHTKYIMYFGGHAFTITLP
jgi:hypothetical protein